MRLYGNYGGVRRLMITRNSLESGVQYGVVFNDTINAENYNIEIHNNSIVGFAMSALQIERAQTRTVAYATCNWWGDASGPANANLNPSGMGGTVTGDLSLRNFQPWSLGQGHDAPCGPTEL